MTSTTPSTKTTTSHFWQKLEREKKPFYIGANDQEIHAMLQSLGLKSLDQLFEHIDSKVKFQQTPPKAQAPMSYDSLMEHLQSLSEKNLSTTSFIGDGLLSFSPSDIVNDICACYSSLP